MAGPWEKKKVKATQEKNILEEGKLAERKLRSSTKTKAQRKPGQGSAGADCTQDTGKLGHGCVPQFPPAQEGAVKTHSALGSILKHQEATYLVPWSRTAPQTCRS